MEIGPQKYEYPINPVVPIVQTMGLYHTTSVVVLRESVERGRPRAWKASTHQSLCRFG